MTIRKILLETISIACRKLSCPPRTFMIGGRWVEAEVASSLVTRDFSLTLGVRLRVTLSYKKEPNLSQRLPLPMCLIHRSDRLSKCVLYPKVPVSDCPTPLIPRKPFSFSRRRYFPLDAWSDGGLDEAI